MKVENNMIVTVHYRGTLSENGEEFDFHILLSWGPQTFANDDTSITVPYHNATFFVGEDKKIQWTGAFYDRTKFVEAYDEDPIK